MTITLRPYQEKALADLAWPIATILLGKVGPERCANTLHGPEHQACCGGHMSDLPDIGIPSAIQLISRADAKAQGLLRYFTGLSCSRGHISERQVANSACLACKNEKRKEFARINPGAVSAANKRHYYANQDAMIARACENARRWPERNRENARRQYRKCPAKYLVYSRNRKARLRAADGSHTAAEIRAIYERQSGCCANCATSLAPGYHADHIMPLARGGSNWISNIQLLCPPCNLSKKALDPIEWARRNGRLL